MPKPTNADEQVTLSKNEFSALMARIEHLENPGIQKKLKHSKDHTGYLRLWKGELTVRVGSEKEDFDVPETSKNRHILDITVVTKEGKTEEKIVNYLDFVTYSGKVPIKFLKINKREHAEVDPEMGGGGYGNKHLVDAEGRSRPDVTGTPLELEVSYIDLSADIEVLEGDYKGQLFSFDKNTINAINA